MPLADHSRLRLSHCQPCWDRVVMTCQILAATSRASRMTMTLGMAHASAGSFRFLTGRRVRRITGLPKRWPPEPRPDARKLPPL
jgi:hypothetical protein